MSCSFITFDKHQSDLVSFMLGLLICHRVCQARGQEIWAGSLPPGTAGTAVRGGLETAGHTLTLGPPLLLSLTLLGPAGCTGNLSNPVSGVQPSDDSPPEWPLPCLTLLQEIITLWQEAQQEMSKTGVSNSNTQWGQMFRLDQKVLDCHWSSSENLPPDVTVEL